MKDPRAGVWAVAGLVLLLLGKWLALRALPPELLILPPLLGRWAMVLTAHHFPPCATGMAADFRDGLGWRQVAIATATVLLVIAPSAALMLVPLVLGFTLIYGQWSGAALGRRHQWRCLWCYLRV